MTIVTTGGSISQLLQTTNDAFDQVVGTTFDYFANTLNGVLYDFYWGNYTPASVTRTVCRGYSPGADGNVVFTGTNFLGNSGKMSSIMFSNANESWTHWNLKGSMSWSNDNGIYNIHATSITIGDTNQGLVLVGNMVIDENGFSGTYTAQTTYYHGMSSTYTGVFDAETGNGTATGITLRDGTGGSITLTGNYDAATVNAILLNVTTISDVLHVPELFTGNDVFTTPDAAADWHGYDGADAMTGGIQADRLFGDDGNDRIYGLRGNDMLDGGAGDDLLDGGIGADVMKGGTGNDTYICDDVLDQAIEIDDLAVDHMDTVVIAYANTLATAFKLIDLNIAAYDHIENVTITGTGLYNVTGNVQDNILTANAWASTMTGGGGNDTYVFNSRLNLAIETDNQGIGHNDTVIIAYANTAKTPLTIDMTAPAFDYIENVTITGTGLFNITGNAWNNVLHGNASANILDGGIGADTMQGHNGNDIYVVDDRGDIVTEETAGTATGGIDTVRSFIGYTLGDNVENLILAGAGDLYGIGNGLANSITGNAGNNHLGGGAGVDVLRGGLGDDTYIVDWTPGRGLAVMQDSVIENRNEGSDTIELRGVSGSLAYVTATLGANLENLNIQQTIATLMNVNGNELNNILVGNNADNTLNGGLGDDIMDGGYGRDTYIFSSAGDRAADSGSLDELDTVQIAYNNASRSVAQTIDMNAVNFCAIEAVQITGSGLFNVIGTGGDDFIYGNAAANTLKGNQGNDTLDGGAGIDRLEGGDGDDTYVIDTVGDVVIDTGGDHDTVVIRAVAGNFTLVDGIEAGRIESAGAVSLTGNDGNNSLTGGDGANRLDGGFGEDTMAGGLGNDTYLVDNANDVVIESNALKSGIDTVISSLDYRLGSNVENLVLTSFAMNGVGNELANTITGNASNNYLDGAGGIDILRGGNGSDRYVVDLVAAVSGVRIQDNVFENANEGTLDVLALRGEILNVPASTIFLGANFEELDASQTGTTLLNLTGNAANNVITGNDAANVIDGGLGSDLMMGGHGNDTYIFDTISDLAFEDDNPGDSDTIDIRYGVKTVTLVTMSAGAYLNIENVTVSGTGLFNIDGTAADNRLTGNASVNYLHGGDGDDTLLGGAGNDFLYGDGGNNMLDGGVGADYMQGDTGNDIYVVDNLGDQIIDAGGNDAVILHLVSGTYELSAGIEVGIIEGSGAVNINGNAEQNDLRGGAGANILDGRAGADYMAGGAGNDTYIVDNINDTVFENGSAAISGIDTVKSSVSYSLSDDVENLVLTGTGAINGTGNALANIITGNASANILEGGLGADTLNGGLGDDRYIVNLELYRGTARLQDTVIEGRYGGGIDTIVLQDHVDNLAVATTLVLAPDIEHMDASQTGMTRLNLTGNAFANKLTGNDADNVINGGAGADLMTGGGGNDTYIFDNVLDRAIETDNLAVGHIDTVIVTYANLSKTIAGIVDLTSGDFQYIENVTLTGAGLFDVKGNDDDNILIGNAAINHLIGGEGNDRLDGGAGNDEMNGGNGDDFYVVDSIGDIIIDSDGYDQVSVKMTGGTYTLAAGIDLAFLFYDTAAVNLTGNALDNHLQGNNSANILDGGTGADSLYGHNGNDVYVVDNAGDTVTEETSGRLGGIDTVRSFIDYTLGANLEHLTLLGTAALHGDGNELANTITGNAGNNVLNGHAGLDTLIGGAGDDVYLVDLIGATGRIVKMEDALVEYKDGGNDTIELHSAPIGATSYTTLTLGAYFENIDASHTGSALLHLTGNASDNILIGNDTANTLNGGLGNDTLIGGHGLDTLYGGAGADTFTFLHDGAFSATDVIKDFSITAGDKIDIHDLLTDYYDPANSHDFLNLTHHTNGTTTLSVDIDGTGTNYAAHDIVSFNDVTPNGVNLDDLLNTRTLVV